MLEIEISGQVFVIQVSESNTVYLFTRLKDARVRSHTFVNTIFHPWNSHRPGRVKHLLATLPSAYTSIIDSITKHEIVFSAEFQRIWKKSEEVCV